MISEQIRTLGINSANIYHEYLKENDKGIKEVEIDSITTEDNVHFSLRLSAELFDTESIIVRHLSTNIDHTELFKVVEYDEDKRILVVKAIKPLPFHFNEERRNEFKVISSLRFLVQKVEEWFTTNGSQLKFPTKASSLKSTIHEIDFEENTSEEQKGAVQQIFSNPFSYVWGAPGTGKTQWVLTQTMLHYMKKGKRIAILAPTNNAIEQVLTAILKIVDKKDISRDKFLRLGSPSKKFAESYPEVCEVMGLKKELDKITKTIEAIQRGREVNITKAKIRDTKNALPLIEKHEEFNKELRALEQRSSEVKKSQYEQEITIELVKDQVINTNSEIDQLLQAKGKVITKLAKWLGMSTINYDEEIQRKRDLLTTLHSKEKIYIERNKHLLANLTEIQIQVAGYNEEKSRSKEHLINAFVWLMPLQHELSSMIDRSIEELKKKVLNAIEDKASQNAAALLISIEYSRYTEKEFDKLIERHEQTKTLLEEKSSEQRLKDVLVVACTLDGHIGRFKDQYLEVEHIFVDEAGYANIIKTLPLFRRDIPITLLGDHKQLPPVCELQDYEILQNERYRDAFIWHMPSTCMDSIFSKTKEECLQLFTQKVELTTNSMLLLQLNMTFRFGANLASILGRYIYTADFISGVHGGDTGIFYIHASKQIGEIGSRKSKAEMDAIAALCQVLDKNGEEYAILTPYRKGQLYTLGQKMPQQRNDQKILTVHGSQGKEWDTVILSVVDTIDKFFTCTQQPNSIGRNLVNTAVSRSKKRLILVCDTDFWMHQNDQLITELINVGEELTIKGFRS